MARYILNRQNLYYQQSGFSFELIIAKTD
jgi:hypothetical protein